MTPNNTMTQPAGLDPLDAVEQLDDAALRALFTRVVREYAHRYEMHGAQLAQPIDPSRLSATEVVIAASELIRAMDLNLFDVAMWFRRPLPVWNEPSAARVGA